MSNKRASRITSRLTCLTGVFLATMLIAASVNPAAQTDIAGPPGSGRFGSSVAVLPNGNIIISDPYYDAGSTIDVGAVYLYDGGTLKLISTLTGSAAGDMVGKWGVWVLSNGNFVVSSQEWNNGAAEKAGAVTWCSGTSGCNGPVTPANSLVGTQTADDIGSNGVWALSNGNYVVVSEFWNNSAVPFAGAVTWCSGASGCTGPVTSTNSLLGTHRGDRVGISGVWVLSNGNYLAGSPFWDNEAVIDAGAMTWCSGTSGCTGSITPTNSLVGTQAEDSVGVGIAMELSNGNYVVNNPDWNNGAVRYAGAVTWCNGISGCSGPVTLANSLVGTQAGDRVGWDGVQMLSNGNYVVISTYWANGSAANAGAVTACSSTIGCSGPVTTTNSLVGTQTGDGVGSARVWALSNGNYVVGSSSWNNGAATKAGAMTWCSGISGCSGPVTAANSLVGAQVDDQVGLYGVKALSNSNYVVSSPFWGNEAAANAGAVTWCSGTGGCSGSVTAANSLVGAHAGDEVSSGSVGALTNGNYVVMSPSWANGAVAAAGAVTWCSGISGCSGLVTTTNSLVGTQTNDQVGLVGVWSLSVSTWVLSNSNYVVSSPYWANGSAAKAGAMTWCSGTTGCTGPVTPANSLVGTQADDRVGLWGLLALSNGNYVVGSPFWTNAMIYYAGAVTWCSGTSGCAGPVTPANSLVGTQANDRVGIWGVQKLSNDTYVVHSPYWNNGAATMSGAVTWGDGTGGTTTGTITNQNSVLGEAAYGGVGMKFAYDSPYGYLVVGRPADIKVTIVFPTFKIYLPLVKK